MTQWTVTIEEDPETGDLILPLPQDLLDCVFPPLFSCSRFLTCEADKSIKIWKENENATELSHPVDMDAWTKDCLKLKQY